MKFKKLLTIFVTSFSLLLTTFYYSAVIANPIEKSPTKRLLTTNEAGMISKGNILESNSKRFLSIDLIKFYWGKEAIKVAKARGEALQDDDGTYYVDDDYYTVDYDGHKLLKYPISNSSKFYVCSYVLNIQTDSAADLKEVDFKTFKRITNSANFNYYQITIQNKSIVKVVQIYVP